MNEQILHWIEIRCPEGEILLTDAQIMARTKQDPRVDKDTLNIWANSREEADHIIEKLKKNMFIDKDYRARIVTDEEHKAGMPEPPQDATKGWWREHYPITIPSWATKREKRRRQADRRLAKKQQEQDAQVG